MVQWFYDDQNGKQEPPTRKFTPPPQIVSGISEKNVIPPPVPTFPESFAEPDRQESEPFIWYVRNRRGNVCHKISETKFRNLIRRGVIDENAFFSRRDPGHSFYIREKVETYPDFWDLSPPKTRLHEEDMARLAWMVSWRVLVALLLAVGLLHAARFLGSLLL